MESKLEVLPWPVLVECLEFQLEESRSGKRPAFDSWKIFEKRLKRLTACVLKDRAHVGTADEEDIVQSILLQLQDPKLLKRLQGFRSVEGYLVRIIQNRANDLARRGGMDAKAANLEERDKQITPPYVRTLEEQRLFDILEQKLNSLKHEDAALLRMRYFTDMSITDIAQKLKISYSAAAVRIFRALGKLKQEILDQTDYEFGER